MSATRRGITASLAAAALYVRRLRHRQPARIRQPRHVRGRSRAYPGKAAADFAGVEASTNIDATATCTTHRRYDDSQNWADLFLPTGEHKPDSVPLVVLIYGGTLASRRSAPTSSCLRPQAGRTRPGRLQPRIPPGGRTGRRLADHVRRRRGHLDYIPNVKKAVPAPRHVRCRRRRHSAGD